MDNLRAVIKNLFCYMSPKEILLSGTVYNDLSKDTFEKLGSSYITGYSNDELHNMYYFFESEFFWQNRKLKDEPPGGISKGDESKFNVFDALTAFNSTVLLEEDEVVCQYAHILRWRDMIVELEEDLFITSYLAYKDCMGADERTNFFWKPVIGHNNRALNRLVAQGIAENHFHLKGSAPLFHLSWISLMNNVDSRKFQSQLDEYEQNRLQTHITYNRYDNYHLSHMWRQAALIRTFLFCMLKDTSFLLQAYRVPKDIFLELCTDEEKRKVQNILKKNGINSRIIDLKRVQELLFIQQDSLSNQTAFDIRRKAAEIWIQQKLTDEKGIWDASGVIQMNIERLQDWGKSILDYTICEEYLTYNPKGRVNEALAGERWFMYQIFRRIYRGKKEDILVKYANWFYLYIVIKANMRRELIQANKNVGFDNFRRYQDRKDIFIDETVYEKIYLKMAVRDTIYNQHISSLEARIAPKESTGAMISSIEKYDNAITEGLKDVEREALLNRYFYVVHFIKRSEHCIAGMDNLEKCRHYQHRKVLEKQARAIVKLRNEGNSAAARILGIDACSPELWCRSEVFGQTFRFLKDHRVKDTDQKYIGFVCPQLMATYHVGEDFLDVIDGLRAIDEAIRFLNLRCGDRLGHALALGVDIDEWYEVKLNRVLINKMGYLDNLMWLYAKIRKYRIGDCTAAIEYIEKRFDEYFKEIYRNNMDTEKIDSILNEAKEYYDGLGVRHGYDYKNLNFGIHEYYDSWKLRGDNPALYEDGYFKIKGNMFDEWDEYAINKEFPINYKIRYNPEISILYYMYHYNKRVKVIGDQIIEIKVNDKIKDAIKKVRIRMQREISDMGIGIEANPSSNYLIGTFRRYDKHPISKWYNLGLTNNMEELDECPQMQISINTDDQGIFATYIENEYAYIALALEKATDQEGKKLYNRTMILQWLDNIRKSGINQSFLKNIPKGCGEYYV